MTVPLIHQESKAAYCLLFVCSSLKLFVSIFMQQHLLKDSAILFHLVSIVAFVTVVFLGDIGLDFIPSKSRQRCMEIAAGAKQSSLSLFLIMN